MDHVFKQILLTAGLCCVLLFNACEEDPPLPDNITEFESDQLGFTSAEAEMTINIHLSRETEADGTITIQLEPTNVVYGTDFTTDPAASANIVTIAVPAGAISASLKILKASGVLLDGDESVKLIIQSTSEKLVLGEKLELVVTFAEIVAPSGNFEVSGGGSQYPNKVFIDLSANRQTAVARTAWDLGFSTTDDFRVILNSPNGMMARALTKTDINTVTWDDTVGFGAQLSLSAVFAAINSSPVPDWVPQATTWIDDPTGDLSKTAMAAVSATASENKVYIVNRGNGPGPNSPVLGWKKVRILRNGANYTLQHADIWATSFTEVQVTKNTDYRFQYVSFETGAIGVEPGKFKWDIAWNGFTNTTNFGSGPVPYYFQDIIVQNMHLVQTAKVMNTTVSYDNFAEANLTGLAFGTSQINIGADWRSGGGPGTAPSVRTDRFYIIKDGDGNYYKLKFTALTTNGERGKPQLQFALVKKGG